MQGHYTELVTPWATAAPSTRGSLRSCMKWTPELCTCGKEGGSMYLFPSFYLLLVKDCHMVYEGSLLDYTNSALMPECCSSHVKEWLQRRLHKESEKWDAAEGRCWEIVSALVTAATDTIRGRLERCTAWGMRDIQYYLLFIPFRCTHALLGVQSVTGSLIW